mmetsp:Transcript_8719/g.32186  ORF Transcript_8719/g.32186 Transcript_8719/m.32186 type:complete len:242 (-) Transcript_8719:1796-2521(-)
MHNTLLGCTNLVLVQNSCKKLTTTNNDITFLFEWLPYRSFQLGSPIVVDMVLLFKSPLEIHQNCGKNLFSRPEVLRKDDTWLKRLNRSIFRHKSVKCLVNKLKVIFSIEKGVLHREQHSRRNMILNETTNRLTSCWINVLQRSMSQELHLCPGELISREMNIHLITIKVGIVGFAVGIMETNDLLIWNWTYTNLVRHETRSVESWLSVEQAIVTIDNMTIHHSDLGENLFGIQVSFCLICA